MSERVLELRPVKESRADFDVVEARIKELFKREMYYPLLKELKEPQSVLKNADEDSALAEAIRVGRITHTQGLFTGRMSAAISRELKELGASWDRAAGGWRLPLSSLPLQVREAIAASEHRFKRKLEAVDKKLAQILPAEIAGSLKVSDAFDRTLWRTDDEFRESVKRVTIAPKLAPEQRKKIADEWQDNMKLWIKDFAEKEIAELRGRVQKAAFAGDRRESLVKTIQSSYGVTARKAKFLARQETSLLMTKFKETRYIDAGVKEYKWGCVSGTKNHPVRPSHKRLEGKIFRWDDPPITTEPGEPARRNNPGQDYNCRCFARPIVRF